jgi:hypothetical protein
MVILPEINTGYKNSNGAQLWRTPLRRINKIDSPQR